MSNVAPLLANQQPPVQDDAITPENPNQQSTSREQTTNPIVHLNVGGKFMSISTSTFHNGREPNNAFQQVIIGRATLHEHITMLTSDSMVNPFHHHTCCVEKTGQPNMYFIDCDAKIFMHVLDWLKYGIYDIEMDHYKTWKLCKVCEMFGLDNLKYQLTTNLKMQQRHASQGHATAQYNLGLMYYQGNLGVPQSLELAVEWFEKSALQGNSNAQHRIGLMYEEGEFLIQSMEKALDWYRKSAEQGHAEAQYHIGVMKYILPQSYEKAFEWYEKSALQNIPEAQYNLALMYEQGKGVNPNIEKALEWFEKSAFQGDDDAQYKLGIMYKDGTFIKQSYEKALEWFEKSALQQNDTAQLQLGIMYLNGLGVSQSDQIALEWFRKSSLQGNVDAQTRINKMRKEDKSNSSLEFIRNTSISGGRSVGRPMSSTSTSISTDFQIVLI